MLAILVPAGIILAYILIANRKNLPPLGKAWPMLVCIPLGAAALIWAGSARSGWTSAQAFPRHAQDALVAYSLIPLVILVVTASTGMMMISLILTKNPKAVFRSLQRGQDYNETEKSAIGCGAAITFAGVMGFINYILSYPLWAFTPVDRWYDAWDQWGMSHGWAGALGPLLGALMYQWVGFPLVATSWLSGGATEHPASANDQLRFATVASTIGRECPKLDGKLS